MQQKGRIMGTCVKCGKETSNAYEYHSADLTHQELTGMTYSANTRTTTYKKTYSNFEHHRDYLCTRCVYGSEYKEAIVGAFVVPIIGAGLVIFLVILMTTIQNPTLTTGLIVAVAGFALAATAGVWFLLARERKAIREDKPMGKTKYSASKGEDQAIVLASKRNPTRSYFTPDQFSKLR